LALGCSMIFDRSWLALGLLAAISSSALGGCSSSAASAGSADSSGGASSSAGLSGPSGTVECATEAGVDTYAPGLTKLGVNSTLTFSLVSSTPAPPALDDNVFVVKVTDLDGNPQGGELSAVLDMPDHGHNSPKTPVITFDARSGTFSLDPMYFFMVGLWRITLTFAPAASGAAGASDSEASVDSAVFKFCVN
jgi:YtkA-like